MNIQTDKRNARKHTEKNLAVIEKSLQELGAGRSIVVDKNGVVIGGNATWEKAKELGLKTKTIHSNGEHLVVVVRDDLDTDDPKRKALALADNRSAELAEWDEEKLGELLQELEESDLNAELAGWDPSEIESIMDDGEYVSEEEQEIPEPPAEPITKTGDLWLLGEHRLLCGDSTCEADVRRLMDNGMAALMNTDPPYGVSYENDMRPNPGVAKPRVAKPRVANDKLQNEALQLFLEKCFSLAVKFALCENAAWYLWHAHLTQGFFAAAAAAAADVILHRQIIWVKPVLLLGRGQYHWKHEPCFMGWVKGNEPPDYGLGNGERTQTTVWEIDSVTQSERKEYNHATPKPVQLFEIPIIKHTLKNELCYEPFSGSGPQFIAAEKTGRKCYGIEISPSYCDVIVRRWENYTGKKAKLS